MRHFSLVRHFKQSRVQYASQLSFTCSDAQSAHRQPHASIRSVAAADIRSIWPGDRACRDRALFGVQAVRGLNHATCTQACDTFIDTEPSRARQTDAK